VKSIHTHEQFSVALGEEAVSVLCGIAFKFLNCLRADNPDQSQCDGRNNQFNPADPDEFRQLCYAVLKCCNSLLVSVSSSSFLFYVLMFWDNHKFLSGLVTAAALISK
jgi:hypothetical protein